MMIPQVTRWFLAAHSRVRHDCLFHCPTQQLFGGMITLIGTSTNLVVSGMLDERGYEPLTMFELSMDLEYPQ